MEHHSIRVIPFSGFIESFSEACYTILHGKQDFIAEEVATKIFFLKYPDFLFAFYFKEPISNRGFQ